MKLERIISVLQKKTWNCQWNLGTEQRRKEKASRTNGKQTESKETTWMDLQDTTLSEVSQMEKNKYHMIPVKCAILKQNKAKQKPNS